MKTSTCPACGAPVAPDQTRCAYCQQHLVREGAPARQPTEPGKPASQAPSNDQRASCGLAFERKSEPNESAFSLAVPVGWVVEGGIYRADLMNRVIDAQSIQPKLDLSVKQDSSGSVMIRWCPEIKYADPRVSMGSMFAAVGMGGNYAGMPTLPLQSAAAYLTQALFPWAHPNARQVQIVEQRSEPALVESYRQGMARLGQPTPFAYEGALATFRYQEEGMVYIEKAKAVIENMGPMAAGMWSNKDTVYIRAPEPEFEHWEPILTHIGSSAVLNPLWLAREVVNQEMLSWAYLNAQQMEQALNRRMLELQQQMQQADRQMELNRDRVRSEIHNDAYLTLMQQEEYVNPFTQHVETGSNQWRYRWVTSGGDEFYTNDEWDNPNIPGLLNSTGWQPTAIRPR